MDCGSWLASPSARPARGWLPVLCALLLCGLSWSLPAQPLDAGPRTGTPLPSPQEQLSERALSLWQSTEILLERLTQRSEEPQAVKRELLRVTEEAAKLKSDLAFWKRQAGEDLRESKASRAALQEIERLLNESETKLAVYTSAHSTYADQAVATIAAREREARTWHAVGIVAIIAAIVGWLVALLF